MADRVHIVGPPLGVVTRQLAEAQAKVTAGAANYVTQSALQVEKNGEDMRFARAARWEKPRATELIAGLARIKDMRKKADSEEELARKDPWHRTRRRRKLGDKK